LLFFLASSPSFLPSFLFLAFIHYSSLPSFHSVLNYSSSFVCFCPFPSFFLFPSSCSYKHYDYTKYSVLQVK
jgi:hypothetical protein